MTFLEWMKLKELGALYTTAPLSENSGSRVQSITTFDNNYTELHFHRWTFHISYTDRHGVVPAPLSGFARTCRRYSCTIAVRGQWLDRPVWNSMRCACNVVFTEPRRHGQRLAVAIKRPQHTWIQHAVGHVHWPVTRWHITYGNVAAKNLSQSTHRPVCTSQCRSSSTAGNFVLTLAHAGAVVRDLRYIYNRQICNVVLL